MNKLAVGHQAPGGQGSLNLRQVEPRPCNRNARTNVGAFGYFAAEILRYQMPPRVKRDDALRVAPLLERPDGCGWIGIGQIRATDRVECAGRHRERTINGIGAAMGADDVTILRSRDRSDDRTALPRGRSPPSNRKLVLRARDRVRSQPDVIGSVGAAHLFRNPKTATARLNDGPDLKTNSIV